MDEPIWGQGRKKGEKYLTLMKNAFFFGKKKIYYRSLSSQSP